MEEDCIRDLLDFYRSEKGRGAAAKKNCIGFAVLLIISGKQFDFLDETAKEFFPLGMIFYRIEIAVEAFLFTKRDVNINPDSTKNFI